MAERINKCRFCKVDGAELLHSPSLGAYYVHCNSCGADGPYYNTDSGLSAEECMERAVSDWNNDAYTKIQERIDTICEVSIPDLENWLCSGKIDRSVYSERRDALDVELKSLEWVLLQMGVFTPRLDGTPLIK